MTQHDRRITPVRSDLAAASLRGKVEASHYAEGVDRIVLHGTADLRRAPSDDAMLETEALHGEVFTVYGGDDGGWSWGQLRRDSYVGYLPSRALSADLAEATHRVPISRTFLYREPSNRSAAAAALPLGSHVTIAGTHGRFSITHRGHYLISDHLVPVASHEDDFVSVAERFHGVPYYWGGKTSLGLDCSGLVQVALDAAGIFAPRDSDMQEESLGERIAFDASLSGSKRGDLVFWKGHVGIMRDATTLLHASGHQMLVVSEPVTEAVARIRTHGGGSVTSVRRLPARSAVSAISDPPSRTR